jgi:hypothetical protein
MKTHTLLVRASIRRIIPVTINCEGQASRGEIAADR